MDVNVKENFKHEELSFSFLKIFLTTIGGTFDSFEKNFGVNDNFTEYLTESYGSDFDQHFSFIYI